jgi:hypothetical protein
MRTTHVILAGIGLAAAAVLHPDLLARTPERTAEVPAPVPVFRSHAVGIIDAGMQVPAEPHYAVLTPLASGLLPGVPPT